MTRSYKDLIVYNNSYEACIKVHKELLPMLPKYEKFDLISQLSRSTKAVPRLIAEGYAKKHQKRGFQKYLDDAMAESNESIVGIEQSRDIYNVNNQLCASLIKSYDITSRQLYKLSIAWSKFKNSLKTKT
jgi:four helix bundle protein